MQLHLPLPNKCFSLTGYFFNTFYSVYPFCNYDFLTLPQVALKEMDIQPADVFQKVFDMLDRGQLTVWDNNYAYPSIPGATESTRINSTSTPVCFNCAENVVRRLFFIYRAKMIGKCDRWFFQVILCGICPSECQRFLCF